MLIDLTTSSVRLGLVLIAVAAAACSPSNGEGARGRGAEAAPAGATRSAEAAAALAATRGNPAVADSTTVTVYKNPTCECCEKWADHLRDAGFTVVLHTADDLDEVKKSTGVPDALATCHTALVGGYVVEGHVPADVIRRMLRERPTVAGLAVPGMPRGVPGMDGPITDRYDVIAFGPGGASRVYASR